MSTPRLDPGNTGELAGRLRDGEVGVVPTDTAYGLAASVEHPRAVRRVFEIKDRSLEKSVPLLTTEDTVRERLGPLEPIRRAMTEFWPGALTLVMSASAPRDYPAGTIRDGTLALREPAHEPLTILLREVGMVTGTSANPAGGTTPESLRAVESSIMESVDFVMEGPELHGNSSTVAEWGSGSQDWIVHRKGPITLPQLRSVTHDSAPGKDRP